MSDQQQSPVWQAADSFGDIFNEWESRVWVIIFVGVLAYVQLYLVNQTLPPSDVAELQKPILFGQGLYELLGTLFAIYILMPVGRMAITIAVMKVRQNA